MAPVAAEKRSVSLAERGRGLWVGSEEACPPVPQVRWSWSEPACW